MVGVGAKGGAGAPPERNFGKLARALRPLRLAKSALAEEGEQELRGHVGLG
jgi:hypothetical protein